MSDRGQQSDEKDKSGEVFTYIAGGFRGGINCMSGGESVSIFKSDYLKILNPNI